jgi:hypothetical protein
MVEALTSLPNGDVSRAARSGMPAASASTTSHG